MAQTRSELRTRVIGHQFSSTQYSSYVNDMLNEAQEDLAGDIDFRALYDSEIYATTANDNTYALPTDYMRNDFLYDNEEGQDAPLTYFDPVEFDLLDTTSTGRPTVYTIDGTNVKFWPTPDAVYSFVHRHYRAPAEMDDDNDTSEIPRSDKCLAFYALARCFEKENDMAQADAYEARYAREKNRLAGWAENDSRPRTQPERVSGMWDTVDVYPSVRMP